jgi:hypothetical protein
MKVVAIEIFGRASPMRPRLRLVKVKLQNRIMHLLRLREANRLSLHPLEVRAEVQILALNILRRFLDYPMPRDC